MTESDLQIHADLIRRVIERHKATAAPDQLVLVALEMIEHEYRHAHEIVPVDAA